MECYPRVYECYEPDGTYTYRYTRMHFIYDRRILYKHLHTYIRRYHRTASANSGSQWGVGFERRFRPRLCVAIPLGLLRDKRACWQLQVACFVVG